MGTRRDNRGQRAALPLLFLLLTSCGGGGGGGSMPPPSGLSYTHPPSFILNQAIAPLTPMVMGQVTSYTVSPSLPAGLQINPVTGVVSGTPTAVAAQANYNVTAANASGSTNFNLEITVNSASVSYSSPYYAFTLGVPATTITPTVTGALFTNWTVSPALPPGLTLDTTTGSISGAPTASAAAANYLVTAANSEGQESFTLKIAVGGAPLLNLGLGGQITLLRYVNSSVLSEDDSGAWLLEDFASGVTLASVSGSQAVPNLSPPYVDLQNNVVIDEAPAGLEVRSATSGQVLATIAPPPQVSWYRLGTDGSYIAAGSPTALTVWSSSGQVLFSRAGNYSGARAFAAPGQVQIAQGAAGLNVIETVSVPTGVSSVSPSFLGVFNAWFLDGARFLTNQGNTVWTYSSNAVQQDITSLPAFTKLSGQGNWFWVLTGNAVNVYKVGASGSPTLSISAGCCLAGAFGSGPTIGIPADGAGQVTIVDLSGTTPTSTTYNVPYAHLIAYAAQSASQWLVGNQNGVVFDGASLATTPRALTLGAAWSIAAGTSFISVATASGKILTFNASDDSLAGTIGFSSSQLSVSTAGTVLAAAANIKDAQYETDRTVNIYSLPSGAAINTFPYSAPQSELAYMSMSGSATVLAEMFVGGTGPCAAQVIPVMSGATIFCNNTGSVTSMRLSPDGTLLATSPVPSGTASTDIYKNGTLVTAVPGVAAGWLDNNRVLLVDYAGMPIDARPVGTAIYDSAANLLANPPLIQIGDSGPGPFQVVTADSVYTPSTNTFTSLTSGATLWASGNASNGVFGAGAITGSQVIFASNNLVLAQPY